MIGAGKADAPVRHTKAVTLWTLVQTAPRFAVLATSDTLDRLKVEMDILVEMHAERCDPLSYRWDIRAADKLFG